MGRGNCVLVYPVSDFVLIVSCSKSIRQDGEASSHIHRPGWAVRWPSSITVLVFLQERFHVDKLYFLVRLTLAHHTVDALSILIFCPMPWRCVQASLDTVL